jgi:alpha-methylacyl-CoA racemase
MTRALEGTRVLDLTRLLPGALATQYLADFGADVIKIEQPGTGDYARHLFTKHGENPVFTATNRGKRSAAIDLKQEAGRALLVALARWADVLIESFRPGVMNRLGAGYEVLHRENPRLIYVALTGYGQEGPMHGAAGHDLNYLAMAGALDLIGERGGPPVVPGVQIADIAGGAMQTALGVLLALAARERNGEGQFVDVSMTRGAASLLTIPLAHGGAARGEGILSGQYACYSVYRCADNRWIAAGALEPKFWAALCKALGRQDLVERQYAPDQAALKAELASIFAERESGEWMRVLAPHDCCITLVRTVAEAAGCDWLHAGRPAPELSETPGTRAARAPALGEHTRDVLWEVGIPEPEIEESLRRGAIA